MSPFAPENLASRDEFGSPVLRQPDHSAHPARPNLLNSSVVFPKPFLLSRRRAEHTWSTFLQSTLVLLVVIMAVKTANLCLSLDRSYT